MDRMELEKLVIDWQEATEKHIATRQNLMVAQRNYDESRAQAYVNCADDGKTHYLSQNLATVDRAVKDARRKLEEAEAENCVAWRTVGLAANWLKVGLALHGVAAEAQTEDDPGTTAA